jgi:lysophospholipase-3
LEAHLNKEDSPAWYCFKTYDWFRIWLSLSELFVQDCWIDNLKINFDPSTGLYNNTYGVELRGIDFGGVDGIDYLDKVWGIPIPFTSVYATIISSLEELGYVAGVNLRGVPYDWR